MPNQPTRRVARVDKSELSEMPAHWTDRERGRYLRGLLRRKGIDADRLYAVEYFPEHLCWVLTQKIESGPERQPSEVLETSEVWGLTRPTQTDEAFYLQAVTEFRRTARAAFARLAAHSSYFASFGCSYQLPEKPQETTAAELAELLRDPASRGVAVNFDAEGGWRARPLEN